MLFAHLFLGYHLIEVPWHSTAHSLYLSLKYKKKSLNVKKTLFKIKTWGLQFRLNDFHYMTNIRLKWIRHHLKNFCRILNIFDTNTKKEYFFYITDTSYKVSVCANTVLLMVLILDCNSEIGALVRIKLCHWTCLRHLIWSRAVLNNFFSFFQKSNFSFMCAQDFLNQHLI